MIIASITETSVIDSASINVNADPVAGDLLLMHVVQYSNFNSALINPAGWTVLHDSAALNVDTNIYAKISDGTENTIAFTSSSGVFDIYAQVRRITGFSGDIDTDIDIGVLASTTETSATSIDALPVTAGWGADPDNLFIVAGFLGRSGNCVFSALPAGYNFTQGSSGVDQYGRTAHMAVGTKVSNAASDDPGSFTSGTFLNYEAIALVLKPAVQYDPQLDTPQADVTIQEGQVDEIPADFSDQNPGDTLTYSIVPDITLVTGFGFSTATGAITYDGNQVAASAVEYTRYADDGNGGTPASDTFTITVIPPQLSVDSISDSTPEAGSNIVVTVSNKAATITAGDYTIVTQDATTVTIETPDPTTLVLSGQTYPTLTFLTDTTITLDDTNVTADAVIQIQPPTGTFYAEITDPDADGMYGNDTGATAGVFSHVYDIVGDVVIDVATGLYAFGAGGGSFKYKLYNGEWGSAATVTAADSDIPVITLNGANPLTHVQNTPWLDPGATVTDNVDANRTITADDVPDNSTVGTYTLYYNATDAAGNAAVQVARTVNVVAANTIPNEVTLTSIGNAALNTAYSATGNITGVDVGQAVAVASGSGEVSNDGGSSWASSVTMVAGLTQFRINVTSSATNATPVTETVVINGRSFSLTVTTIAAVTLTFAIDSNDPLTDQAGALINYTVPIVEAWTGAPEEAGETVVDSWTNVVIADGQLSISGSGVQALTDYLIILRDTGNSLSHYHRIVGQFA